MTKYRSGDLVRCIDPIGTLVDGKVYEVFRSYESPIGGECILVFYRGTKTQPPDQNSAGWFAFRFKMEPRPW